MHSPVFASLGLTEKEAVRGVHQLLKISGSPGPACNVREIGQCLVEFNGGQFLDGLAEI
jgi:hypothetical protein